jgi:hypothetical protein
LESGIPLSDYAHIFLQRKGLLALSRYAHYVDSFTETAESEQVKRYLATGAKPLNRQEQKQVEQKIKEDALQAKAKQAREKKAAEKKLQQEAVKKIKRRGENDRKIRAKVEQPELRRKNYYSDMARINFPQAFEIDPKLQEKDIQAKKQTQADKENFRLREKYGLGNLIENPDFPKLMDILRRVHNSERLSENDFAWLETTKRARYFTTTLKKGYHRNEAIFYAGEFKKKKDYWLAVNASSHYRKCDKAKTADSLLSTIDVARLKNVKLKSALFTTHGGVKRDLGKWDEALNFGKQAHLLTPKNFRPCTLLGAVNMEIGHHNLGQSWYKKAVELGYSQKAVDDELRSIFRSAETPKQDELRKYLLKLDPVRYSWARKKFGKNRINIE